MILTSVPTAVYCIVTSVLHWKRVSFFTNHTLRCFKDWVQLFCVHCGNYPWGETYCIINRKPVVSMWTMLELGMI